MSEDDAPFVLADGTVVDDAAAERIVNEVVAAVAAGRGAISFPRRGRPSLAGGTGPSPAIGFRLTPEVRQRAEELARRRGITVSALAREALEDYLRRAG